MRRSMLMHEPSCVEVNLSALDHNMAAIRRLVGPECKLCPIVKADAYGLGASRVARRLATAGADLVAVYSLPQAAELGLGVGSSSEHSPAPLGVPVLVLMPVADIRRGDETSRMLMSGRLHLTIHDLAQCEALGAIAERFATVIPVHLEVDTGLSRGGARPEEAARLLDRIAKDPRFVLKGVFTHFASSRTDREATDAQLAIFDNLLTANAHALAEDTDVHVASTYALFRHRRYHRSMVRFGLAWAGFGLEELDGGEMELGDDLLRPCLRWRSRIVQVKRIPAGTAVGYGSRWVAKRPSTIGLIPVGYADGFPVYRPDLTGPESSNAQPQRIAVLREVARGARTEIVREFAPVIGAVNMDQITVDLTDLDLLTQRDGGVGLSVELVSPDPTAPNHLPRLAARSGMIPHEMLCRVHPKIPRIYSVDGIAAEDGTSEATATGEATGQRTESRSGGGRAAVG
jgi:alanine racemase